MGTPLTIKNLPKPETEDQKSLASRNNLARVATEEQNGPGFWEFARESGSDSTKTTHWGLRYTSI